MYSIRPNRTFSHTKTRPRVPLHAPPCSYRERRYLDTRIQTIIQRYNREVMNDKNKKQLVIDMLSIVTDKDVTNEQIQTCIHYLNDMDAWAVSGAPDNKAWEDVPSPWN